ncbi:MAG TPA: alpha/beta hydrolase [Clostridia bacterium]|nr:alpha/beta hydrolase [Clostridia bacterium]
MNTQTINLSSKGNATLTSYILDSSEEMSNMLKRPAVLICPGGAYRYCSGREAEPIAMAFLSQGYNAFVLRYSVGKKTAKFPNPLNDAEQALELIRENAQGWNICKDKVAVIGFSAGGHLAAALSTMGRVRPDATILGYPCILDSTSDTLAEPVPSLETKVDSKTSPTFIFAASNDKTVPIINSLKYAQALDKNQIPFEMHIFQRGGHGFSLGTKVVLSDEKAICENMGTKRWLKMCFDWLENVFDK